jgi:colicin import membrane protein
VDRRTSSVVEPQIIPLKKRKTEPKSVSSQSQEKPKQEKVTKKEDPKTFLEKRLAAIRDNVNKKKSAESETGHAMGGSPNSGVSGQHQGSGITDLETARWFDIVRQRVNSQWSVFSDNRNVRSVTVIGVKISDSGELVNPTVDESSGDYVFDKSALRAVSRAAPFLPPVPEQVRVKIRQSGGLALRFTPSGMQ